LTLLLRINAPRPAASSPNFLEGGFVSDKITSAFPAGPLISVPCSTRTYGMKKNSIISSLFALCCCYGPPSIYAQSSQTPEQILEQTFRSYAQLTTYQDQGSAETVVKRNNRNSRISTTTFSTFIRRPDKLRREWRDSSFAEQRRSVMTSSLQGIDIFLAWRNRYTRMDNSPGSWGRVFGVWGNQTITVPSIMRIGHAETNDPGSTFLSSLRELRLLESQEFEGELCYVIAGKLIDADYRIWIGMNDHLIRQIEEHIQSLNKVIERIERETPEQKQDEDWLSKLFPPDSTDRSLSHREIYREIKINQQINDEVFQFTPPPGAKFVEEGNLSGGRDSFWAAIPNSIKRELRISLVFLILSFVAVSLVIWAILKKKVAGPKN
jgi:hypothetical protein